jgi:hypothetical protein
MKVNYDRIEEIIAEQSGNWSDENVEAFRSLIHNATRHAPAGSDLEKLKNKWIDQANHLAGEIVIEK